MAWLSIAAAATLLERTLHDHQDVSQRLQDTVQKIQAGPKKVLSDPTTAQILAEEIAKKASKKRSA